MKKYLVYDKEYETDWIMVTEKKPLPINGYIDLENLLRVTNILSEEESFFDWKISMGKTFKDRPSIVINIAIHHTRNLILLIAIDKHTFEIFAYKEVSLPKLDDFPMIENTITM